MFLLLWKKKKDSEGDLLKKNFMTPGPLKHILMDSDKKGIFKFEDNLDQTFEYLFKILIILSSRANEASYKS